MTKTNLFIIFIFSISTVLASTNFADPQVLFTAQDGVKEVSTEDFNGDGTIDFVNVCTNSNSVLLFLSDAPLSWSDIPIQFSITDPVAINSLDFDGDGDLDLAIVSRSTGNIYTLENDTGNGTSWTLSTIATGLQQPNDVVHADFDRDGDQDLAITETGEDRIFWIENRLSTGEVWQLNEVETSATIALNMVEAYKLAVTDLNHDGMMDLLVAPRAGSFIMMLENVDRATSWDAQVYAGPLQNPTFIATGFLGRDFYEDFAVTFSDGTLYCVNQHTRTNTHGTSFKHYYDPDRGTPYTVTFGDLDMDGDGDLIYATSEGIFWTEVDSHVSGYIYYQDIHELTLTNQNTYILEAFDLDSDGDLDIVGGNSVTDTIFWIENRTLHGQTFATVETEITANNYGDVLNELGTIDLDGNGREDLFAPAFNSTRQYQFIQGDDIDLPWTQELHYHPFSDVPVALAYDINLDGEKDFIQPSYNGDNVTWSSNPPETRGYAVVGGSFNTPHGTCAADFDRDGDPDILVGSGGISGGGALFEHTSSNQSAMHWTMHTTAALLAATTQLLVSDLNRDGLEDVINVGGWTGVTYLQNDGTDAGGAVQWLTRALFSHSGTGFIKVKLADINKDGRDDLLVLRDGLSIEWHQSPEDPMVDPWPVVTIALASQLPSEVCAHDVDHDGDMDILFLTESPVKLYMAEQINPDTHLFFTRLLWEVPDSAQSRVQHMLLNDLNVDGLFEVIYENRVNSAALSKIQLETAHVNMEVSGYDITALPGSIKPLLAFRLHHLGRTGDVPISMGTLGFRYTDEFGSPLTTFEANTVFDSLRLFRDNGDSIFDESDDTLVATISQLSPVNGEEAITFLIDDRYRIEAKQWAVFFIVATVGNPLANACRFQIEFTDDTRFFHRYDPDITAEIHYQTVDFAQLEIGQSELSFHLEDWPEQSVLDLLPYAEQIIVCP